MPTHAEALLISAVINSEDTLSYGAAGIIKDHFHVYDTEWRWLEKYVVRYGRTPSRTIFKIKFPEFPFRMNVEDVEILSEDVRREHARFVFNDAMDRTLDFVDGDDIEAAIKVWRTGLHQVEAATAGQSASFSVFNDADLVYADVKHRVELATQRGQAGIPTGFKTLDLLTGGLQEGEYAVVAARVGNGKTWTLTATTLAASLAGVSTLFVTLEMTKHQMTYRFHNLLSSKFGRRVFSEHRLNGWTELQLAGVQVFPGELEEADWARRYSCS